MRKQKEKSVMLISTTTAAHSLRQKILGGLLPYRKVWTAGANDATVFLIDRRIAIAGKKFPADKYSFFATPGETERIIFFNSETGQYGSKDGAKPISIPQGQ